MLPRNFQSRHRRHLSNIKLRFQITRARRSLNQLSRFRIHPVQEFHIIRIQPRKNVCETNIVALHDQTPQRISLPDHPAFLLRFSRRHHRSNRDVRIATKPTSLLLLLRFVLFCFSSKKKKMPFFWRNLECNFTFQNCELYYSKISRDDANHRALATRTHHTQKKNRFDGGAKYRSPYLSNANRPLYLRRLRV